ncbi:hypothetical protein G7070_15155 [Propioniciclava coleopterorum]|uniref:N-acetylmuramoyl-L-alanine amidase n=1 Tax=Propioniciclava coleopterorum TaxID=2714937 RepID=A0A6G7Y9K1_9ACTN|nr:N-acetylmuramoyl-L-alanine amidase [Propioniciclava coleopterorum]QIK73356.1 hypothetical protein G7070_15155 [Propioniciclava coleopterorum]
MTVDRRRLLLAGALLPWAAWAAPAVAAAPAAPVIRPRSEWAGTLAPVGPLQPETDVRFLLVHHTETPNGDTPEKTVERLRGIYRFHTGADKGWPDVAYNFFVDRFGVVWEGRQGSLERAVRGDATGGSQGFAELACFVGDHTAEPPTEEALTAMTGLLAWLAARNGLDLAAPVSFVSRGSNRWRRGAEVATEQIAGHRDMSRTACPGDALYPLITSRLLPGARQLLAGAPSPSPSPTATPSPAASGSAPAPTVGPSPTPPPLEGISWGGAALTALGVAGVAFSARAGRGEPQAGTGRRDAGSDDELEQDDGGADADGDQQPEQEPPQGG